MEKEVGRRVGGGACTRADQRNVAQVHKYGEAVQSPRSSRTERLANTDYCCQKAVVKSDCKGPIDRDPVDISEGKQI